MYLKNKSKIWATTANEARGQAQAIRYWDIISQAQCKTIAAAAPLNKIEFLECSTMGVHKDRKWGQSIIAAIKEFYIENDLWGGVPAKRKAQQAWSPEVPSGASSSKKSRTSISKPTKLATRLSMSQETENIGNSADPYADSGIDWDQLNGATTTSTSGSASTPAAIDSLQLTQTFKSQHFGSSNNRDTPSPSLLPPKVKNPYQNRQNKLSKYRMKVRVLRGAKDGG